MGVAPLAETEPQRVVLDARLGPAAECLNTACENLQAAATQSDPAKEQLLRAEAHLSFAQLHMTAAQRLQTPAGEVGTQSGTPLIPAGAQLVRALTEAQDFEAEASALQASWMQAALRRTACVSYVALEACEVAVQISWKSQEYSTYHDLLDREERKLDEAFAGMRPGELPGRVVAAAEVWLDDAYDNITLAQACLAVRSRREKRRIEMLEEYPEPPDGETSAEKARRLWMQRAFLQTTFTSRMAQEACNDSTETAWTYHEHRRLLDDEMMAVCRIYAEVEWADLPAHEGEKAQKWLMITHRNIERAREHVAMRIREAGEWGAPPSLPKGRYSYRQEDRRRVVRATLQAEAAATQVRLQAVGTDGASGKPQPVTKADTETKETRGGRPRGPAYPCVTSRTRAGQAELDSETDTSDPGGMPQLFREPRALSAGLPEALRRLVRRWAATRGTAPRPGAATEPRAEAEGPTPLGDRECKVCKGGISDTSVVSQAVAQGAEEGGGEEAVSEVTVQGAGESSESDDDEGDSGLRSELRARADSSPAEVGDSDEETPALGQSPGQSDEFARELAGTMSAIANLVVKATGRSVSNGGVAVFQRDARRLPSVQGEVPAVSGNVP
jgi:hypothetical protein